MSSSAPVGARRLTWMLLGAALALLVDALVSVVMSSDAATPPAAGPAVTATPDPGPASSRRVDPPVATTRPDPVEGKRRPAAQRHPRLHPGIPRWLVIPALGVNADVVPVDAPDGVLVPPPDPQVLGWWSAGARPGVRLGSALITGHTVHTGGGALDDLADLEVGGFIEVRTPRLRMPYVVQSVRTYGKGRVAADASNLFDQDVLGRLVVVTCTDWNGSVYLSNVVVTAVPKHSAEYLRQHPRPAGRFAPRVLARAHPE